MSALYDLDIGCPARLGLQRVIDSWAVLALGNYWEPVLPEGTEMPLQRIVDGTTALAGQHCSSWGLKPDGEEGEEGCRTPS